MEGFSRVTLPMLEPPPAGSIKSPLALADSQELQYLYQSGPKEEVTPPFREGGGDRAHYWWIFMPPFHFASIANDMELRQGFATGYSVSDDGLEYLLHINPDAIFQDGTKITAAALKDAWEFAAYPDNQVGWGAILLHTRAIQGMSALEAGDATEASGLKVVDDHTLSITMEQFTPTWAAADGGVDARHLQLRPGEERSRGLQDQPHRRRPLPGPRTTTRLTRSTTTGPSTIGASPPSWTGS